VKLDIQKKGNLIGYVMGAGDDVPKALQQLGYEVELLEENDIRIPYLSNFDAIIIGIRAYNTVNWLRYRNDRLHEYVKRGGTLITQYNTSSRLVTQDLAPYELQLSRDRVSDETAEVRVLQPSHPVLNTPNEITQEDFAGWVQERGLYFPDEWNEQFTPILSMNDPGEDEKKGSLLVAPYGDGHYIYTGLSFFRELPAGVPGAYRLLTNLISLGQDDPVERGNE
jgi:menaquinone-dependent protoporphyrinogen IX oxidase